MNNKKQKLNWYCYRNCDGKEDREICQYMRLDYLIQLLETRKYYVSRRRVFPDLNESYQNKEMNFPMNVAHGDDSYSQKDRPIPYVDIIHCPTSCWTLKTSESYLMWKSYATEIGVCIKSTVHNLIASLELDLAIDGKDTVVCGSMLYENICPTYNEEKQLFSKDIVYSDENEFRFYFYLSDDNTKRTTNFCLIPVDPNVMIDKIILSPFICKDASEKIARMIKCSYGIDSVKPSNIKLK